jgi:hypothetical protein
MADGELNDQQREVERDTKTMQLYGLPFKDIARIADALEASTAILKENSQLCREDLEFRREQAAKADAEKEMFLKMFMGGAQPQPAPAAPIGLVNENAVRRRQRNAARHDHPEPPEAA